VVPPVVRSRSGINNGGHGRTEVVFVSACHSATAGHAFVAAGVPHVVAVRLDSKVPDKAAMG
jgi:hypothetical protein